MRNSEFEFIRTLVYAHSRINLGSDKQELVKARLGKRLRATQSSSIADYCSFLQGPARQDELGHLIDAISTNHTFFFREPAHFDFVRQRILPEMFQRRHAERWSCFTAWSAACSSGEEPYSLAMTLFEFLQGKGWDWQIEATDISRPVLEKARAGIFREEAAAKLPAAQLKTHFQSGVGPQAGNCRVRAVLRDRVHFQHLNLLEGEAPFVAPFHVIFCRNVMIYFDRKTQEELINKLTRHLVPGGYLLVGHSESLTGINHSLEPVGPAIYRRSLAA